MFGILLGVQQENLQRLHLWSFNKKVGELKEL